MKFSRPDQEDVELRQPFLAFRGVGTAIAEALVAQDPRGSVLYGRRTR